MEELFQMTINQIIENFTHINKDVPLINLNGTSLYIDDILLIDAFFRLFNGGDDRLQLHHTGVLAGLDGLSVA